MEHLRNIKNEKVESPLGFHFKKYHNSDGKNLTGTILEKVHCVKGMCLKNKLQWKEALFILKFDTLHPKGLNRELDWKWLL